MVLVLVFVRDLNADLRHSLRDEHGQRVLRSRASGGGADAGAAGRTPGGERADDAGRSRARRSSPRRSAGCWWSLPARMRASSLDAISFFVSAGLVASLTIRREPAAPGTRGLERAVLPDAGLRFIFTHRAISFVMISMACGMFAVRCFGSLLSVWVRDVLLSERPHLRTVEYADRRRHDRRQPDGTQAVRARGAGAARELWRWLEWGWRWR